MSMDDWIALCAVAGILLVVLGIDILLRKRQ